MWSDTDIDTDTDTDAVTDTDTDTDTDFLNHCAIQVTQFSCDDLDLLAPAGWLLLNFNFLQFCDYHFTFLHFCDYHFTPKPSIQSNLLVNTHFEFSVV